MKLLLQWLANPKSVDELPSIQNRTGAVMGAGSLKPMDRISAVIWSKTLLYVDTTIGHSSLLKHLSIPIGHHPWSLWAYPTGAQHTNENK